MKYVACPAALLLAPLLLLTSPLALAQGSVPAPHWQAVLGVAPTGEGEVSVQATAVDAQGNVLVAGSFKGELTLGSSTLTSAGGTDAFVAKWSPASRRWVWATAGGGANDDACQALAVVGTSVYCAGFYTNNTAYDNDAEIAFGSLSLPHAEAAGKLDVFVVKYSDAGAAATPVWAVHGGGTESDAAVSVAVSGANVYVTGRFENDAADTNKVVFDGLALPGTGPDSNGDVFVVKYLDQGATAAAQWAQHGGGLRNDSGSSVVASGGSVYVTGSATSVGVNPVRFGPLALPDAAGGPQAAGYDMFLVKYRDAGPTAAPVWAVRGGGTADDFGSALALSGTSLYVACTFTNDAANTRQVQFGRLSLAGAGKMDVGLVKYVDNGLTAAAVWAGSGGGGGYDSANAIVVDGTGIYLTGKFSNSAADEQKVRFGGRVLPGFGSGSEFGEDVFVVKYLEKGSGVAFGWATAAGGLADDSGLGLACANGRLYVVGHLQSEKAAFGQAVMTGQAEAKAGFLAELPDK